MNELIVRGKADESKALRWLLKAVSNDSNRKALNHLIITDDFTAGIDGFRVHAIQTPECLKLHNIPGETMLLSGKIPAGDFTAVMDVCDEEVTPPPLDTVIPGGEPVFEIAINPQFLIEAMQGLEKGKPAYFRFYTTEGPFEVGQPETNRYAMIMPMWKRHKSESFWRPVEPTEEGEEGEQE
jgi:hypothetical protein